MQPVCIVVGPGNRWISGRRTLALASLVARVALVDDVNATLAANQTVLTVTGLQRLERVSDLHGLARLPGPYGPIVGP